MVRFKFGLGLGLAPMGLPGAGRVWGGEGSLEVDSFSPGAVQRSGKPNGHPPPLGSVSLLPLLL